MKHFRPRPADDPFLSDSEVSALLNVPRSTLAAWRKSGDGPEFHGLGKRVTRYRLSAVDKVLQATKSGIGRVA